MEYPYGQGAVVWLRSSQAFYKIISVAEPYQSVWQPLKTLLDITGHTINVLIRSNVNLESQSVVRKVAGLARQSGKEVVGQIGAGRDFVIEQVKCQSSALAKHQFFKDLAGAKTWIALRNAVNSSPELDVIAASDSDSEPLIRKISNKMKLALPPPPPASALKAKLIPPGSVSVVKNKGGRPPKVKKLPIPVQKARRSPSSLSLLPGNLKALPLPDELQFDYTCPFCGLTLSKSRSLTRLKPRIELHLRQHGDDTPEKRHKDFAKRFDRFLEYLEDRRKESGPAVPMRRNEKPTVVSEATEVMEWPERPQARASGVPLAPVEGLAIMEHLPSAPSLQQKPAAVPAAQVWAPPPSPLLPAVPLPFTSRPSAAPMNKPAGKAPTHGMRPPASQPTFRPPPPPVADISIQTHQGEPMRPGAHPSTAIRPAYAVAQFAVAPRPPSPHASVAQVPPPQPPAPRPPVAQALPAQAPPAPRPQAPPQAHPAAPRPSAPPAQVTSAPRHPVPLTQVSAPARPHPPPAPPVVRSVSSSQPIDLSQGSPRKAKDSPDQIVIGGNPSPKKPKVYIDTTTTVSASSRKVKVPQRDPIDLTDSPRPHASQPP